MDDDLLSDEADDLEQLNGKLSFSDDSTSVEVQQGVLSAGRAVASSHQQSPSPRKFLQPSKVFFQVVSAKTVKVSHRDKYVSYRIVIQASGTGSCQAMMERRYTQFRNLNEALLASFPKEMQNVNLPKKTLIGNFNMKTIAERSRAFEKYLSNIYRLSPTVNHLPAYQQFFWGPELAQIYELIHKEEYREAISKLSNCLSIEEKLLAAGDSVVTATTCALLHCYLSCDQMDEAVNLASAVLENISKNDRYLIALLQQTVSLYFSLGKDRKKLQERLEVLRKQGVDVDKVPSLKQLVLSECVEVGPIANTVSL